ncbi:MAG: CDP-alcohol phosphatidyltransferase family protein [Actinomycetes bacterium]
MRIQETAIQTDRVLTIPNGLTALRLIGVPVFLWLVLGPRADGWAAAVLIGSAATDWLDGFVARATGSISRLGQLLDPLADRLYVLATLFGLLVRGIIPWWLPALLVGRDLVLAGVLAALKRRGVIGLPVHFLGKAATFNLMLAFPLLLLGAGSTGFARTALVLGWALAGWGTGLYGYAGWLYLRQARKFLIGPPRRLSSDQVTRP